MNVHYTILLQRIVDIYAKVIKWGCLMPIAAGFLILLILPVVGLFVDLSDVGYVPELDLHYKITRDSYDTDDGRNIKQARLYFSRTDTFETDYIDFKYTVVNYPIIYYVKPDTFYIVDRDNLIQDISSKEFNIISLNHNKAPIKEIETLKEYEERYIRQKHEDSILRAKSYNFDLSGYTNYVTIFDPQGEIIYEKNFKLF